MLFVSQNVTVTNLEPLKEETRIRAALIRCTADKAEAGRMDLRIDTGIHIARRNSQEALIFNSQFSV